ncbi:MAG: hypothetical protein WCK35_04445 [Chloroflexota bacterium]
MNPQFLDLLGKSEKLADAHKIQSARAIYDEMIALDFDPETQALNLYNSAVFHMDYLVDGVKAVDLFDKTYQHYANHPEINSLPKIGEFLAYTCENRMLLSLSYDEYDLWADRLRALRPDEAILLGQVPIIHEKREAGMPWSDMVQMIATSYYNRNDPQLDPGLYGRAAGVYQLLLENRRKLRLNREDWAKVVYEFGALLEKLNMECMRAMEEANQIYPDECLFYLELARNRVDEFLQSNQPSDTITFLSNSIDKMLEMSAQGNRGLAPADISIPFGERDIRSMPKLSILSCLPTLALIGVIIYVFGKFFSWW